MARHFYHIPLQNTLAFIKEHRSILNELLDDPKKLAYRAIMGRGYYTPQVEKFIAFFRIERDIDYALRTAEYFHGRDFMGEMAKALDFARFSRGGGRSIDEKSLFYALCHLYGAKEPEAFERFVQKSLLYHHAPFNPASKVQIDHKEMSLLLAKDRKLTLRESFGENETEAFFRISLNGKPAADERGRRIKTLRKKAYRKLFYILLDMEEAGGEAAEKGLEV